MITSISFDLRSDSNVPSSQSYDLFRVDPSSKRAVFNPDGTPNEQFTEIRPEFLPSEDSRNSYCRDHVQPNASAFADFVLDHYSDRFDEDVRSYDELRDAIISRYVETWLKSDVFDFFDFFETHDQDERVDWADSANDDGSFSCDDVDMSDVVFDPAVESRLAFLKRWHKIRLERIHGEEKTDG